MQGLPTLRVNLARDREGQLTAAFEVASGPAGLGIITAVPTRSMGLADRIRSAHDVEESAFMLPPGLVDAIADALRGLAADAPAFWLDLPSPRGYLQLIPWERLLSPALGRPLLRLPSFAVRPSAPGTTLRIVVVAGQAAGVPEFDVASAVADVVEAWTASVGREVHLEVLVDVASYPRVRDRLADRPEAAVHDPRRAAAPRTSSGPDDEDGWAYPWLEWAVAEMSGTAADVIHLVGHGAVAADRGAFALPATPSAEGPDRYGRLIGASQLCHALSRLGAWSLLLSGVPGNQCPPGLRDLADTVAQTRSGIVLLHQMQSPDLLTELMPALSMVFAGIRPNRPLPGICCWSHPQFVSFPPDKRSELCTDDGTSTLIAPATYEALAQHDTPTWVAAGTRALENLQAQWTSPDGGALDMASAEALHEVSRLFDAHVQAFGLADPTHPRDETS